MGEDRHELVMIGGLRSGNRRDLTACILIAALAGATLALGSGRLPVQIWDEARVGINAIEMMRSGHLLVPTFHSEPDLWNPKPPFATWAAALSMRLFGINEVAFRLPSLLAAIATTFAVYLFTRKVAGSASIGALGSTLLLGMGGYAEVHVARTADPDCLLVLSLMIATAALFLGAQADGKRSRKWYFVTAAAFAAAMLSKGIAAFLIVPGWVLGLVATGRFGRAVQDRSAWLAAAACGLVALLYCGLVAAEDPRFLAAGWTLDIAGRWTRPSENLGGPIYYYLRLLAWPWQASVLKGVHEIPYSASAFPWSLVALILFPVVLGARDGERRRASIFVASTLVGFIAILSAAATKLPHYVAPAYPLIAILVALEIEELAHCAREIRFGRAVVPVAWVIAIVCTTFVVAKNRQEESSAAQSRDGRLPSFVRRLTPDLPHNRPVFVVSDARWDARKIRNGQLLENRPYDGATEFYIYAARARGVDIRLVDRGFDPGKGSLLIGCGIPLDRHDAADVILESGQCATIAR